MRFWSGRIALLESEFYSESHQSLIIYIEHIKLHAAGAQQAGVRAGPKSYYIYCRQGALKYAIHFSVIWLFCADSTGSTQNGGCHL